METLEASEQSSEPIDATARGRRSQVVLRGARRLAGEFAVIVMGVLVALGVDEWREARGERALASESITGLVADLEGDSASLSLMGRAVERQRRSLERIRNDASLETRELLQQHRNIAFMIELPASGATYEDLLATGHLSLIRDPDVRQAVVVYHRYVDNARANLRDARAGLGLLAPPAAYASLLPPAALSRDDLSQLSDSVIQTVDAVHVRATNPVVRSYLEGVSAYLSVVEQIVGNLQPRNAALLEQLRGGRQTEASPD